jgi:hypothetical protein
LLLQAPYRNQGMAKAHNYRLVARQVRPERNLLPWCSHHLKGSSLGTAAESFLLRPLLDRACRHLGKAAVAQTDLLVVRALVLALLLARVKEV